MANKKGPKDDKLIQELYEKLDWFTFEATDEEFDPDQVNAIVNLLDTLDPLEESYIHQPADEGSSEEEEQLVPVSDPQAAFERFKKKYHITEEDLLRKNGKAAPEKATEEKIVPFPTEFSEELTPNRADVHELTGQTAEEKDELSVASGQTAQRIEAKSAMDTDASATASDKTNKKRRRSFLSSVWGKVAVALIVVVVMGAVLTVGTSAVHQKSFFETIQSGVNSVRIIVTGNEMESESEVSIVGTADDNMVYFDSWEEVAEESQDVLIPGYIPNGMQLRELFKWDNGNYVLYKGIYDAEDSADLLIICVKEFIRDYADMELIEGSGWNLIGSDDDDIIYYEGGEYYKAVWKKGKYICEIEWINLEDIDMIISQMK